MSGHARRYTVYLLLICLLLGGCSRDVRPSETAEVSTAAPSGETGSAADTHDSEEGQTVSVPVTTPGSTETERTPETETAAESTAETETETVTDTETETVTEDGRELYTLEEVTAFFAEVALNSEYYTGEEDANSVIRKWTEPIRYYIYGDFDESDEEIISDFYAQISAEISGFPGAERVYSEEESTLTMGFIAEEDFQDEMGQYVDYETVDGCVTFWFDTGIYSIINEVIGYNNGMMPEERRSVILEEIYNGLGLVNDTDSREDSLIYQYGSETEEMSPVDRALLYLLYLPDMECGMGYEECAEVIADHYGELTEYIVK